MSKKIKIYHILTHTLEPLYPSLKNNPNGFFELDHTVNRFIKNLIKYDTNNNFQHILINLSSSIKSNKIEGMHKDGYKTIILKTKSLFYPLEFSYELIKFIKNTNDGIFHIHGTACFIYDTIAPYLKNKPSIAHYRGGHFTWKSFPISFPKYFLIQPITLRFPQKILVQNKYRLNYFKNVYKIPEYKLEYIPNGIDLKNFNLENTNKETIKSEFHIKNKNLNILFVGRLEKAKGIIELLEAFKKLSYKFKNINLLIAGYGSLKNIIEKESNNKNIFYFGHLNQEKLKKLYYISDIFVLPTHFDSMPNVILEAMAFNLPVISTKVEGPLTAVEHGKNGFLIKPKDKKELQYYLKLLITDEKLRKKLGEYGKIKLEKEFDIKNIINKVLNIYNYFS